MNVKSSLLTPVGPKSPYKEKAVKMIEAALNDGIVDMYAVVMEARANIIKSDKNRKTVRRVIEKTPEEFGDALEEQKRELTS